GFFLGGLGQANLIPLETPPWSPSLDGIAWLGRGSLLGIPMPVVTFGATALLVGLVLRKTRLGAFIYALGDNPLAARATGVPTRPIILAKDLLSAAVGSC